MDKVIVSLESQFKILILVLLQFSLILKKITVATKLQHDAGNTAVPAKKKNQHKKRRHRFRKSMLWRRQHVYSLF